MNKDDILTFCSLIFVYLLRLSVWMENPKANSSSTMPVCLIVVDSIRDRKKRQIKCSSQTWRGAHLVQIWLFYRLYLTHLAMVWRDAIYETSSSRSSKRFVYLSLFFVLLTFFVYYANNALFSAKNYKIREFQRFFGRSQFKNPLRRH